MKICVRCDARFDRTDWGCPACGFAPEIADEIALLAPLIAGVNEDDATYLHDELAAAEARHFWFEARNRLILAVLRWSFPQARSFLDLGCGTGGVLAAIERARPDLALVAGDALLAGLGVAKRRARRASVVQLDVRRLPYDGEFDVVGVFDVLEHLDDDEAVLAEMRRATKPGGGVIITVPQHPFLWSTVDEFSRHRRRYTRAGLLHKVRRAGFTVERATSFMTLVLPALALSRMMRRSRAGFDPAAELHIGGAANACLRALCRVEYEMIALGSSSPVGGSLLVVARAAMNRTD